MALVVILSLCSAFSYGLADFLGGVLTRRASAWAVAAATQAAAAALTVVLATTNAGDVRTASVLWSVLAGVGGGAGSVLIFRGLADGRMAVVAPVSAIAAGALPVLVGLGVGERPGTAPMVGVLLALPAIWLVSGGDSGLRHAGRADVIRGLAAGVAFGVQFSALGQIPREAGLTPLAISQVASVCAIVVAASALSKSWLPRDRFSGLGAVAGVFTGLASVCFQLAVQRGLLTVAGVLASLYPAMTVLLAAIVLRERIHLQQGIGLTLAVAAVALIGAG
jgi:uncharacterized membrane protein